MNMSFMQCMTTMYFLFIQKTNEDTLSHINFDLITGKTAIVKTETRPQLTCMNTVKTKDNLFYIYG